MSIYAKLYRDRSAFGVEFVFLDGASVTGT